MGEVLKPPASGRVELVTRNPARSATLRLMSETPAPVSMAKTNGPRPLIQPVASRPRSRSSRSLIGPIPADVCST
jgi:hypothetical protein